ncbi:MAG: hypothetical protein LUE27_00830 [Clostridia bacterium]|nr:hypothetical protein [Clostridia bacterium]
MSDFTGKKVTHRKFGEGVIISCEQEMPDKNGRHFTVRFPSGKEMAVSSPSIFVNGFMTTEDPDLLAQIGDDIVSLERFQKSFDENQRIRQEQLQDAGMANLRKYRSSGSRKNVRARAEDDIGSGRVELYGMHIKMPSTALEKDKNNDGHVCIGWHEMGDLSGISAKDELKDLYVRRFPGRTQSTMNTDVGEIWTFLSKVKPGDVIVYFDNENGRRIAHFGIALGGYYFKDDYPGQDPDYVHNREVKWIKDCSYEDLKDDTFLKSLDATLSTTLSIWSLEPYRDQIAKILDKLYDINVL